LPVLRSSSISARWPCGTDSFTYDAASQLTAATHSYQTNESYSYDANGNRTNTGYTTGTNNQISSDGTYNYTFDNNGNLAQKTAISGGAYTTYTWDFRNRLTDVQNYTSTGTLTKHVHYTYDVFDRLIGKQLDPTGGGTYTSAQRFVYDGNNIILAFNSSGTLTDRLLPLPVGEGRGEGASQTLADEKSSGAINWYFVDNLGTTRDVAQYNSGTNTTTVVDHLKFDSFGNITAQSNSANQPLFAFTGQMWDADAGLYWYHARWYQGQRALMEELRRTGKIAPGA
jgi:YD repeat-containing protein